jgi:hypothetical protein
MEMTRRLLAAAAAALGLLVFTATAGAQTLGITGPPSGAFTSTCGFGDLIGQQSSDPGTPFVIPTGGGSITQWQTYTVGDTPGASLSLVVLQPTGGAGAQVAAIDTETLPNPLPANHIASFTLAKPITVAAGDTLTLFSDTTYACYFFNGTTPTSDVLFHLNLPTSAPTVGQALTIVSSSANQHVLNLAATLAQQQDVGVQTLAFPAAIDSADSSLLRSLVTNNGPADTPITFTDQVPSSLHVVLAATDLGSCTTSGQTVTCTITGLPVGQSTAVNVIVTPTGPGSFSNEVSVGVGSDVTDPDSTNNQASATIAAGALPDACVVPGLRGARLNAARRMLRELGCRVQVVHRHSRRRAGTVLSVRGGVRTYSFGTTITLVVSSGAGPHRRHR